MITLMLEDFMHKISFIFLFPLLLLKMPISCYELQLTCPDGVTVSLDIDNQENLLSVLEGAKNFIVEEKGLSMKGWIPNLAFVNPKPRAMDQRNYWTSVQQSESDAIRFIVLILGNEPLWNLPKYEPELNKAAERFKNVHPMNVWGEIFGSKDTTSALVNMRSRKLVWKPFMKGMSESLQEAYNGDNIKDEYIADLSKRIGVDQNMLKKNLKGQDWSGFVQYLIDNAKKSSKDDRYNM